MTASKPTFIIVHGAWHRPVHFQLLTAELHKHGYKTLSPTLPSVDLAPGYTTPSSEEDIAVVRAAIHSELDNAQNNVILVPHSYGGIPTSGAIEGLDITSRRNQGKETGVIGISALVSFVLAEGMDINTIQESNLPSEPELWDPPPAALFWQDVPVDSEVFKWAEKELSIMSMKALTDKCRFSAYKVVPVHYLMASEDQAIKLEVQEKIVSRMREDGGNVRTELLEGCSHSPFLSRVEETVAFLRRSAGEKV